MSAISHPRSSPSPNPTTPSKPLIPMTEVRSHNTSSSCWMVIHGSVYDVTSFIEHHPGGEGPILASAGKDATDGFAKIHSKAVLKMLSEGSYLGEVDMATVNDSDRAVYDFSSHPSTELTSKPPLEHILNVYDLESLASQMMNKQGWDYYSSGADDEITLRENHAAFQRIWLKPRVLVNVSRIDTSTKILGYHSSFPLLTSPTALGKLAHPDGEVAITRAAFKEGVIQICPTLSSCSLEEMIQAREPGQVQFYQLYVNRDRQRTYEIVKQVEQGGCKALCVTVDAPMLGRREKDLRNKFTSSFPEFQKKEKLERKKGVSSSISQFIDPSLNWKDIDWLKSITNLPIIIKGIQCVEDALLAYQYGTAGIVISNHGGRQLDCARSAIEVLPEVIAAFRSAGVPRSFEVWVDGGIRRGSDVFKALALGATAVGMGRPVLYGLATYGQEGVEYAIRMIREELEVCMAMMGVTRIQDIREDMVLYKALSQHLNVVPDYLNSDTYIKLKPLGISKL